MLSSPRRQIAALLGSAGVLCALILVVFGDTRDLNYVWGNEVVVVVLAGPAAWLAGLAVADLMGKDGLWGWSGTFTGFALATVLGAMIAGSFLLPVLGTLIAPMVLLDNFVANPIIAIAWIACFIALHKITMFIRC